MSDPVAPNARIVTVETTRIEWLKGGYIESVVVTPEEALSIRDALNNTYPPEAK